MDVDLDAVHLREEGMTAAEILMSESQERMLAIVRPADLEDVLAVAARWEIDASPIGTVTDGGLLRVRHRGELVAEVPASSLAEGAPLYRRPRRRPDDLDAVWADQPGLPATIDAGAALLRLLSDPAHGDRAPVYQQYDHMLFLNTVIEPGHDGSVLRIRGTDKALAVSTDGDGPRCALDPRRGAARIVWEAALNVAVTGARPLALVDNLNFGNPEKPEVMWQFVETVEGLSTACEALGIPVVGGNVSFYNETAGVDIHPTPVVGMLGLADPRPRYRPGSTAPSPAWRCGCSAPTTTPTSPGPPSPASCSAAAGAGRRPRTRRPAPPWWRAPSSWRDGARYSTTCLPGVWRWRWPRSPSAPVSALR